MSKFWNWTHAESGEDALELKGPIAEESWWGDEVTPKLFNAELKKRAGKDITVWINSPGGDVFAASQIYTALMEHKGNVNVKIDGYAMSAASVIAMAGTNVSMSPTAVMMIHNPWALAIGDSHEMNHMADVLDEVKNSIINAYEIKTGLERKELSKLMDAETYMNAKKALEKGFIDEILYEDKKKKDRDKDDDNCKSYSFSRMAVFNTFIDKIKASEQEKVRAEPKEVPVDEFIKKIELTRRKNNV